MDILQYIDRIKRNYGNEPVPVRYNTQQYLQGGRVKYRGAGLVDHGPEGVRQGYARPGGNPEFGKTITGTLRKGTVQAKTQTKLDLLKELIDRENSLYRKNKDIAELLNEAGWKGGWDSVKTGSETRKLIHKYKEKLLTTQQKMDNYVNNVMLAEDALVKDFRNPKQHLAKKFGVSKSFMDKWSSPDHYNSKVWAENKKLFTGLSNEFSFNKYKLLPDGTPRLMHDYSVIKYNQLPYTQGLHRGSSREKFILESAHRHNKYAKHAGISSQVTFINKNYELLPMNQWQFIKNGKLYSLDPSIDTVEFRGQTYKNNYLNRVDAAKLYKKDFGEVYKVFDELDVYMDTEVINPKTGKPIKLDKLLQERAHKLTGKKGYYKRRFMDIDHADIMKNPFGELRLLDATTNKRAGIIKRLEKYRNNPKLLASKLDEIGYNRKFNNTDELIKFYSGTVGAVPKVKIPPGGPTLGTNLANVDADMFDFRKLPGDVRHFADIAARYGAKSPALLNALQKAKGAGKWTGVALAAEPAFAAPFAEYGYKMGESPERILGDATFGLFGETEQEELKKATGELGYATQQIENYGSTLNALKENYRTLNDQNDPRGEKRQRILNLYNNTRGKYNTAYSMFVDDQGQFDKSMYNQALNNYTAGVVQIDKFKKQLQDERVEQAGGYDNILQEREIKDIKGYAGGGLTRTVAPDSGPMSGLPSLYNRARRK